MDAVALLLADSRFPSGSYAHSLGLEQAVTDGLTDVPAFIAARQRLVAEPDARFAVEAGRVGPNPARAVRVRGAPCGPERALRRGPPRARARVVRAHAERGAARRIAAARRPASAQ